MKPMYETSTRITLDEFRKLNRQFSSQRYLVFVLAAFEALAVGLIIYDLHRGESILVDIAMLVLFPIIIYLVPRYVERRMYLGNDSVHDSISVTRFYKDYFQQANQKGTSRVEYYRLQKIVETPTNFYLVLTRDHMVIIVKQNCSRKLIGFLQQLKKDLESGKLKKPSEQTSGRTSGE